MNTFQIKISTAIVATGLGLITFLSPNITYSEDTPSKQKFDVHINLDGTDTMMYSKNSFEVH